MSFQRRGGRKRAVVPDGNGSVGAAQFEAWLDRLTGLDRGGRMVELTNLPETAWVRLEQQAAATPSCMH